MSEKKTAIEALHESFEAFKAKNDARLAEIEAKGSADVITREEVDRINADISEKLAELQKLQAAEQKRLDDIDIEFQARSVGPGGGKGDPKADEKAARQWFAGRHNTPDYPISAEHVEEYRAYRDAWPVFLRNAPDSARFKPEIKAAMSVGSDPDGGYWVPAEVSSSLKQRLFETSPMRQAASVISITTDSIKFPTDTNDSTSGGWVGEVTARPVTATPQVGEQEIYVREQYASPKATQKLLDMATIDVEGWLNGKIADKLSRVENTAFVTGAGVNQPRGFLDYGAAATTAADSARAWGVLQYVASGAAGAFAGTSPGDPLITIVHTMHPNYRAGASWFMNRATAGEVRKLKDGQGNYLWSMGNVQAGQPPSLLGFGVMEFEDMPAIAADSFSIAFANMGVGYQIVDGRGIRVLRDPFTDKPWVIFYTTKWTGGDVVNFDAIKLFKFAAS